MNEQPPIVPPSPAPKQHKTALAIVVTVFVILGIMALVNRAGRQTDNANTNPVTVFTVGEEVRINFNQDRQRATGVALLAVDETALDQFIAIAQSGDDTGLDALFESRRLVSVKNGTRVRVLKQTANRVRLRVVEGEMTGQEGWTTTQFLVRLNEL